MSTKFGLKVLLFLLLVDLPLTMGRKCGSGKYCKVNEASPRPVSFKLCDNRIMQYYKMICQGEVESRRRRKRDLSTDLFVQSKNEAQDFLSFRRRKRDDHQTNIMEECCNERCRTEEIREYC